MEHKDKPKGIKGKEANSESSANRVGLKGKSNANSEQQNSPFLIQLINEEHAENLKVEKKITLPFLPEPDLSEAKNHIKEEEEDPKADVVMPFLIEKLEAEESEESKSSSEENSEAIEKDKPFLIQIIEEENLGKKPEKEEKGLPFLIDLPEEDPKDKTPKNKGPAVPFLLKQMNLEAEELERDVEEKSS